MVLMLWLLAKYARPDARDGRHALARWLSSGLAFWFSLTDEQPRREALEPLVGQVLFAPRARCPPAPDRSGFALWNFGTELAAASANSSQTM